MSFNRERYENGWYAFAEYEKPPMRSTDWLERQGWDGLGVWAFVKIEDLKKSIPGLKIVQPSSVVAKLCIDFVHRNDLGGVQFIDRVQGMCLNVAAVAHKIELECVIGTLVRTYLGTTEIIGRFNLVFQATPTSPIASCVVPGKLLVTDLPGCAYFPDNIEQVPSFRVPCKLEFRSTAYDEYLIDNYDNGTQFNTQAVEVLQDKKRSLSVFSKVGSKKFWQ